MNNKLEKLISDFIIKNKKYPKVYSNNRNYSKLDDIGKVLFNKNCDGMIGKYYGIELYCDENIIEDDKFILK